MHTRMSTVFAPGARVGAAPLPNAQAAAGGIAGHTPAQVHVQALTAYITVSNSLLVFY